MMNVAIIDDEENNRLIVKKIISREFPNLSILVEEGDVEQTVTKINEAKPDLIFLDIRLKNGTGFDVIDRLTYTPRIIFTTAYSEYALKAIKAKAFDYLLKPIDDAELIKSVRDLEQEMMQPVDEQEAATDFFSYATNAGKMYVKKTDILYFEGSGSYTYMVTEAKKILISKNIGELEAELMDESFYRTHKSFIINTSKIKHVDVKRTGFITLLNGQLVPLAQRKVKDFIQLLNNFKA